MAGLVEGIPPGLDRPRSEPAIQLMAGMIGEADSILSRTHSAGFAGASEARILDRIDPLATLAAKT